MRELTIAQTFLLFDAMVKLHVLVNGGGDSSGTASAAPANTGTDSVMNAQALRDHGFFNVSHGSLSDLHPDIQKNLLENPLP